MPCEARQAGSVLKPGDEKAHGRVAEPIPDGQQRWRMKAAVSSPCPERLSAPMHRTTPAAGTANGVRPCRRGVDPTSEGKEPCRACCLRLRRLYVRRTGAARKNQRRSNGRAPCSIIRQIPRFPLRHRKEAGGPRFPKCPGKCGNQSPAVEQEPAGEALRRQLHGQGSGGFMRIVAHCAEQKNDQRHARPGPGNGPPATRRTGGTSPTGAPSRTRPPSATDKARPPSSQPRTFHGLMKTSPALCYGCSHRGVRGHATRGPASALPDDSAIPRTRREWVVSLSRQPPVLFV